MSFQKIKPKGKMAPDELCKLLSGLAKQKKISEEWKQILVEDNAWKLDLQEPSPVKKMFDPKELPFVDLAAKRKSLKPPETQEEDVTPSMKPDLTKRRQTKPALNNLDKQIPPGKKRQSLVPTFVR